MGGVMLRVEGLSKKLGDFEVKNVGFDVERRDYFVLLGASGVGKTVLLEAITGITLPDDGRILLAGRDITREPIQRRNIGLVFQDARDLEITPLLGRRPGTLSGGEAQRVALARALATDPACLLLDEPLSSLDVGARSGMRALLRRLNRDGLTMVHVTHDYEEAISLATRIGIMERGTIVQTGRPDEVFRRPTSEFVARFVGIRNFFPGVLVTGDEPVFCFSGLSLSLLTDAGEGEGYIIIGSEDVVISLGRPKTSARNMFTGIIEDIFPVRVGIEVIVDIGVDVAALVTRQSVEALGLEVGKEVWVSVKASAVRFVEA
jgi:molybdate/tungstate transport system ATP-binding protein